MNRLFRALGIVGLCVGVIASTAVGQDAQAAAADMDPQLRALLAVRDSVARVRNEIARFRRDLSMVGSQTVVGRSRRLTSACQGLQAALSQARPNLRARPGAPAQVRRASEAMLDEMRAMSATLDTECRTGLRPEGPGEWPDSLKSWGPHRTNNMEQRIVAYERAAATFAKASDLEFPPKGH